MHDTYIDAPRSYRVLVALTFHYVEARLSWLVHTLRALSSWPVARIKIFLYVNKQEDDVVESLNAFLGEVLGDIEYEIIWVSELSSPWHLTWSHKPLLEYFLSSAEFTHFLYTEDDVQINFSCFEYWQKYRRLLRPYGLLPSFVRIEYNPRLRRITLPDFFWQVYIPFQNYVEVGDRVCVSVPNPYNPFFIFDRELAVEYISSKSFDEKESGERCTWGLAERAAMGLCNENIPEGFPHRYVVGIHKSGLVPIDTQVFHTPSNYANHPYLGKICLDSAFVGTHECAHANEASPSISACSPNLPSWVRDASNIKNADPSCYFLVTFFDTILYFDFLTKQVRQQPFGIAPMNLMVSIVGEHAEFLAIDDQGATHRVIWGGDVDEATSGLRQIRMSFYQGGTFAFSANSEFLSADPGGPIFWDRTHCRAWEHFRLIRVDTVIGLSWLRRTTWLGEHGLAFNWIDQPVDFGRFSLSECSALAATITESALVKRRLFKYGYSKFNLTGYIHHPIFLMDSIESPTKIIIDEHLGETHAYKRVL